jgi:hypothetical protein
MSKKLAIAIAERKVVVYNRTAGEAIVFLPTPEGEEKRVLVPGHAKIELAPKHTDAHLLKRSRNLKNLLYKGVLRIL